ncbi:MAG TPA: (2Fe-2S)-binding protein [Pseudonocardiaceae bacterium]
MPNHSIEGDGAMYVCICRAVTEAAVRGCIADGARTVKDVVKRCEAGTGCGTCIDKILTLLSTGVEGLGNSLPRSA